MATQLSLFLSFVFPFFVLWLCLLNEWLPFLTKGFSQTTRTAIFYAPALVIVALGVYALTTVLFGVFTFNDCNQEQIDLMAEVKEAKSDLKKRKVL